MYYPSTCLEGLRETTKNVSQDSRSRRLRKARYIVKMGETRNAHRIFLGKPLWKLPIGRSRKRWVYYIKIYLGRQAVRIGGGWTGLMIILNCRIGRMN
jgi:hypothetical protein